MRPLSRSNPLITLTTISLLTLTLLTLARPKVGNTRAHHRWDETDLYLETEALGGELSLFPRGELLDDHKRGRQLNTRHARSSQLSDNHSTLSTVIGKNGFIGPRRLTKRDWEGDDESDAELDEQEDEPSAEGEDAETEEGWDFGSIMRRQLSDFFGDGSSRVSSAADGVTASKDRSTSLASTSQEQRQEETTSAGATAATSSAAAEVTASLTPSAAPVASTSGPSSSASATQRVKATAPRTRSARPASNPASPSRATPTSQANAQLISSALSATTPSDSTPPPSAATASAVALPNSDDSTAPTSTLDQSTDTAQSSTSTLPLAAPVTQQGNSTPPASSQMSIATIVGILLAVVGGVILLSAAITLLIKRRQSSNLPRVSPFENEKPPPILQSVVTVGGSISRGARNASGKLPNFARPNPNRHPLDNYNQLDAPLRLNGAEMDGITPFVLDMPPFVEVDSHSSGGAMNRGMLVRRKRSVQSNPNTPAKSSTALQPVFEFPPTESSSIVSSRRASSMSDATATAGSYEDYQLHPTPRNLTRDSYTTLGQSIAREETTSREARKALVLAIQTQLGRDDAGSERFEGASALSGGVRFGE